MAEPKNNYPLSTEQNDTIPLEVAKPEALYWLTASTTAAPLTFKEDDNNIFCITSDVLAFISTNPAITAVGDLVTGAVNEGVYLITPQFSYTLALPKEVVIFCVATDATKNIYLQEIVRWAAAGGQAISYGAS